jgi:hypothetical protein
MKRSLLVCFIAISAFCSEAFAQCASPANVYSFDFAGHTYKIIKEKQSWTDAASCATNMGGKLAEITTKAENDTIFAHLSRAGVQIGYAIPSDGGGATYVWIGATDKLNEGVWLWDGDNNGVGDNFWNGQGQTGDGNGEGVVGMYFNWGGTSEGGASPNEPDDFIATQDCGAMALDFWPKGTIPPYIGIAGEWNDLSVTDQLFYVVEKNCLDKQIQRDTAICQGQKIFLGGQFRTTGGVYVDSLKTPLGCDSVISTTLTILGVDVAEIDSTICQGDTVDFGGTKRFLAGRYEATFQSSMGCDSLVALTLAVTPTINRTRTTTICRGESADVGGGNMQSEPGQYPFTYTAASGCDSIVVTTLIVNSADTSVSSNGVTLTSNASGAVYQWLDCDNGNALIAGQTSQNFTPTAAGHFAVVVTQNGCTDTSACYAASPSSVIENTFPTPISVYPNPATDRITVDLGDVYGNVYLKLTALDGREVRHVVNSQGETFTLSMTDLASGSYFLQIHSREKSALIKVIKK